MDKSLIAIIILSLIAGFSFKWFLGTQSSNIMISEGENYQSKLNEKLKQKKLNQDKVTLYKDGYLELPSNYIVYYSKNNSYSMLPSIQEKYTMVAEPVESLEEIEVGDIIGFELNKTTITHRVYQVNEEENCAVTLGDNNQYLDGCIPMKDVKSKVTTIIAGKADTIGEIK